MCVLPWTKVYGVFNAKYVYIFNILLFEVGSAVCGAAPNMTALILGRVIAGVGGSGMYSGTLSFVAMLTTIEERPIYMAGSTVIWGIGSVLGPVVSSISVIISNMCADRGAIIYRLAGRLQTAQRLGDG